MAAKRQDITLEEGGDLTFTVLRYDKYGQRVDISAYGAKGQVRNSTSAATALITFSIDGGQITVGAETGEYNIVVPAASIDAIKGTILDTAGWDMYDWPVAASPEVNPVRLVEGNVLYKHSHTKLP